MSISLDPPDMAHDHAELGPECTPRKVLMSPELMVQMAEAASGRRITIDWGKPDDYGFYVPTITSHEEKP